MLKTFVIIILWCTFNITIAHGCASLRSADESIRMLQEKIQTDQIGQVQVFYVPYNRLPSIAVSPSALERSWEIETDHVKWPEYIKSLNATLRNARFCASLSEPALHWGVVIRDKRGDRIISIYLDKNYFFNSNVRGKIDGINITTNHELISWFEDNFSKGLLRKRPSAVE